MTGRRYLPAIPHNQLTGRERSQLAEARRGATTLRQAEAAQRGDGRREHAIDPTDPWSATEWFVCPPDCSIHPQEKP